MVRSEVKIQYTKTSNQVNWITETFESLNELIDVIRNRPNNEAYRGRPKSEITKSFTGVSTEEEAFSLMRNGWDLHLPKVKAIYEKVLKNKIQNNPSKYQLVQNVIGVVPHIPNVLKGIPTNMIRIKRDVKKNKVLHFLIDIGYSGSTDIDEIIEWGSKILAELQVLEANGYRVRVETMDTHMDGSGDDVIETLKLLCKHESEPFDLKRFMFPIAHPAMLRYVSFRWEETVPGGQYRSGKGKPLYILQRLNESAYKTIQDKLVSNNYIYINIKTDLQQLFGNIK
jgi:hypothetical protein